MSLNFSPRHETATAEMPGNPIFWDAVLEESDRFAYETAQDEKGGPFGAQLWAVNKVTNEYVLIADPKHMQDSNAVISKGIASAHAEAENLSPENRQRAKEFLKLNQTESFDWEIVQTSSGESCPSCRSKQVMFSEELKASKLIAKDGFNVYYKATYEQTAKIAGFNDEPFDATFRAIGQSGPLEDRSALFGLEDALKSDAQTGDMVKSGDLLYNPVTLAPPAQIPDSVRGLMGYYSTVPFAAVVTKDNRVLSSAFSTHKNSGQVEDNAIIKALQKAAMAKREKGVFESWNLDGAKLITNIRAIGPAAYAETLWYNLSGIEVAEYMNSEEIDLMAAEIPGMTNAQAWELVAAEYNAPDASINVRFAKDLQEQLPEEVLRTNGSTSVAHLFWHAKMKYEALLSRQAERIVSLKNAGIEKFHIFNGKEIFEAPLTELIVASERSSNYDAKAAPTFDDSGVQPP